MNDVRTCYWRVFDNWWINCYIKNGKTVAFFCETDPKKLENLLAFPFICDAISLTEIEEVTEIIKNMILEVEQRK